MEHSLRLILLGVIALESSAFLLTSASKRFSIIRIPEYGSRNAKFRSTSTKSFLNVQRVMMSTGSGFGGNQRKFKLEYGGGNSDPQEQVQSWELAYKAFVRRAGKQLTALSWKGYEEFGRGAIFAHKDGKIASKRGKNLRGPEHSNELTTMYVSQQNYEARRPETEHESANLQQIISRIKGYDPRKEFVVVFEAAGLMGADIVRPSVPPPEMFTILGDKIPVLKSEEWNEDGTRGGDGDKADLIDMTSLIMDALEEESSVLDITAQLEKWSNDTSGQR